MTQSPIMECSHGVTSISATNGCSGHYGPEAGSSFGPLRNLDEGLSILYTQSKRQHGSGLFSKASTPDGTGLSWGVGRMTAQCVLCCGF